MTIEATIRAAAATVKANQAAYVRAYQNSGSSFIGGLNLMRAQASLEAAEKALAVACSKRNKI